MAAPHGGTCQPNTERLEVEEQSVLVVLIHIYSFLHWRSMIREDGYDHISPTVTGTLEKPQGQRWGDLLCSEMEGLNDMPNSVTSGVTGPMSAF